MVNKSYGPPEADGLNDGEKKRLIPGDAEGIKALSNFVRLNQIKKDLWPGLWAAPGYHSRLRKRAKHRWNKRKQAFYKEVKEHNQNVKNLLAISAPSNAVYSLQSLILK